MEIAWEDRGRIPYNTFWSQRSDSVLTDRPFKTLHKNEKKWWNRVFDACVAAEKKMVPGGTEILITGDNNG